MKANKETIREYYKIVDGEQTAVNLYDSNNQTYIDSSTYHFDIGSVTAWSTTQIYNLNHTISAKDITITTTGWVQANAGWTITIDCTTEQGETNILTKDFGYNVAPEITSTFDFNPMRDGVKIKSIKIYAYCYRRSTSYCYGGINIGLSYTPRHVELSNETDYNYYVDRDVYSLPIKQIPIYEKYKFEYLNTLPTYANATEGETGINGISFSPGAMYFCVARTVQSTVTNSYDYKVVWQFGGREFKLDTCTYQGYVVNLRTPYASLTQIEGSNDNETWEVVTTPVNNYYRYYRFTFVGSETHKYAGMGMQYFNLTGMLREKVVSTNGEPVEIVTHYQGISD